MSDSSNHEVPKCPGCGSALHSLDGGWWCLNCPATKRPAPSRTEGAGFDAGISLDGAAGESRVAVPGDEQITVNRRIKNLAVEYERFADSPVRPGTTGSEMTEAIATRNMARMVAVNLRAALDGDSQ